MARESLEALLERLQTTKSIEELQVWAHELRDHLGVSHVLYHTVKLNGENVGAFTYDIEWVRIYIENDYKSIDPVVLGAVRRFHPIDWKTLDWSPPAARKLLRDAMTFGIGNQGWSIPLWGPAGEFAMFTVNHRASDDEWQAIIRERAKDFLLIAHLVHQQAKRIINREVAEPTRELSPREREALTMLSAGMNRAEVADRLHISENTLRAYIDSARHKLGAMNVTHAVALALSHGIIGPNEALPKY
ncbi:MAG TPA: LuxR family transcriptional regulator [Amaricoccus sp.]|uniref:helix-turn-helix transcriptional regulator n=1 Tax=Amaricoccus sp. TaxID=1872485 RepID=UPI002C0AA435|nr:LuxR family transcriptional regulator [Amaricoccus sp.]HPG22516.1 LuxR family transcriptional regulator [Amaricoccus sp.]HRW14507.1 LuxR family transcriptional regulator [Amaricoccus sp.]